VINHDNGILWSENDKVAGSGQCGNVLFDKICLQGCFVNGQSWENDTSAE